MAYFDVFLSFRGKDVRKNFVDHLYRAMEQSGIYAFKDDEKLERGKSISPALEKAIEDSSIAVVIFSEHYAESTWCLEELVKIMECMEMKGQIVLPIFYDVDPSTVRRQKGKFGEAFAKHKERFENEGEKVEKWRKVLEAASNLSGRELNKTENGHEAKFIEKIIGDIIDKLGPKFSSDDPNLVGMERHMQRLYPLISLGSSDVRFVGIFGMSGTGKTTIATALYKKISNQFESSCFIHEVRAETAKHGPVHLQQKLLSEILSIKDLKISNVFEAEKMLQRLHFKKVLIVLDDVDHKDQLESLVGKGDWFGKGSRIIITTKDKHLLISHKVSCMRYYQMNVLNKGESTELFRKHAFKKQLPANKEFVELETQVLRHAGGLPLALRVLGSFLCGRHIAEWKSEVARLGKIPKIEIIKKLEGSFHGLEEFDQRVFLDIACFFNRKKKESIIRILNSFDFSPDLGIAVLRQRCLITVSKGRVFMHELLQQLGRYIVCQEASKELKSYSRLWLPEDISQLLTGSEGTDKIEGISLNFQAAMNVKVNSEAFKHMAKLRFLKFHNANASHGPNSLPDDLRWLDWHGYPSKTLPASFQGQKLVGLKMQYSRVIQLWKGLKVLDNLKFINLSHSQNLIWTPDFTGIPNLERLILEDCSSLVEIHHSVGFLKNLVLLNLRNCLNLKRLPKSIHFEKLETLILTGCSKVENFPEIPGPMACLLEVYVGDTAIRELPLSIKYLTCARLIDLGYCKHFVSLPSSICGLKVLKTLILSGCSKFERLPDELGEIECLEELYCDETAIQELPSSISLLKKLETLSFRGCKSLASPSPCSFVLSRLLPGSFQDTKASPSLSLSGLSSLLQLDLSDCSMLDGGVLCDLGELPSLKILNLSNNKFVSIPTESIAGLTRLHEISLVGCSKLESLPELPSSITAIFADECTSLIGNIDLLTKYPKLSIVSFSKCTQLLQDPHYNNIVDAFWQHMLKMRLRIPNRNFGICFPGSVIPDWFTYKNWGPSLSVDLPQNWYNNKFMGFALCAVSNLITTTALRDHSNLVTKSYLRFSNVINTHFGIAFKFSFTTGDGREKGILNMGASWKGSEQNTNSEFTCMTCVYLGPLNERCRIEISSFDDFVCTGFGLRLVYEDDVRPSDEPLMIQNNVFSN